MHLRQTHGNYIKASHIITAKIDKVLERTALKVVIVRAMSRCNENVRSLSIERIESHHLQALGKMARSVQNAPSDPGTIHKPSYMPCLRKLQEWLDNRQPEPSQL